MDPKQYAELRKKLGAMPIYQNPNSTINTLNGFFKTVSQKHFGGKRRGIKL